MFRLKYAARAALLLAVAACTSDVTAPAAPGDAGPAQTISDAAHSGAVPGFYFLPPMVSSPAYSGTFDAGLQPRVEICQLAGTTCAVTIAQYTTTSGTGGELVKLTSGAYQVNWHTNQFALDPTKTYRISVFVGTFRLGFADVDVVSSGKELKNVNTQEFIPLQDGRTLPIKFRIETGIAGQVIVSPDSAEVPVGGTQQFTATVLDLHGNPLAAPVTWSSSNPPVATVDGSGLATGVSIGQAIITATAQGASDGAVLTVVNNNTPPVANPDTFQAIGNVTVPVAAPGVLANDTDVDGNPLSAVPGTITTAAGGTVTLTADGSFTYLSPAGFTGEDSFVHTVTDGVDSVTATATVTSAYRVWYVDNAGAAPGDGRDTSPFTTLKAAEAASATGETIFLRAGNGTSAGYDEGIVLKTGQSLTGQGVPANVTATLNGQTVVLLEAGAAPTVTSAAGTTVQVSTNNVLQGFNVGSAAGAGIGGTGFGTLTVAAVSVGANGGPALDLSSGDVLGAFGSLSSSTSTGAGIRLLGVGGSFSAAGGTINVTGGATAGVDVTGGAGTFSYDGDIVATGPLAVSVTGRTGGALTFGGTIASTGSGIAVQNNGGGAIAFNGGTKTLSTGANPGVRLQNNAGAAISFGGGGLAVSTAGATAFEATGGGTVTVTGAGNTLVSTGATALRVENTTIGGAGLSFRSVNASGGANGIVLVNTGALNGVQVTGTGSAGSGGTITGMSGDGVRLADVRNVILSSMSIQGNQGSGIAGASVDGFALNGSVVLNNADDAAADEAGIRFDNLSGVSSISGSEIAGSIEDNVRVVNTAGVLTLSVTGTTIRDNSAGAAGQDGLRLLAGGNAQMTVNVSGSDILRNRAIGISSATEGAGVLHVTVTGGSLRNNNVGVSFAHGSSGALTFNVLNIPVITGQTASPINVNRLATASAGSTFSGTISGNVIGTAGVTNSGATAGPGVRVVSNGVSGAVTVAVTGNTIREVNNRGIDVLARDGGSTINATIRDNNVVLTAASALEAIRVDAGALSSDAVKVCADIRGNTATTPSLSGIRVRQRFAGTTFQLAGYAGAPTDNAAVAAFLASNNTASATLADNGGPGFVGVASCPTP
ncbi:Ig-like domain-containing protein [Longimicrobium sp.]|uniref:Ig-like domain-containing protein n=1 Tax=Longimicrobium sp. TaxID=2029185 RepID=UPI002E302AFC|nr:Ig-like domain-containing protein [Longimicrobium sp.]HEX6041125.1 Ig-like domain-containing protein [Longimicrobium sp.]